jgi:hypothetical protein
MKELFRVGAIRAVGFAKDDDFVLGDFALNKRAGSLATRHNVVMLLCSWRVAMIESC